MFVRSFASKDDFDARITSELRKHELADRAKVLDGDFVVPDCGLNVFCESFFGHFDMVHFDA
jgi:hypothetical protein